MSSNEQHAMHENGCETVRAEFSAYLDGAMSGVEMTAMAAHLDGCEPCSEEFTEWRSIQRTLSELGPAKAPERLQAQLRSALEAERARGTHLGFVRRLVFVWQNSIAPAALRVSGGLAVALVLVGGLGWMFGAPIAANDDNMAHLIGPHYLYSQVPPQPIETRYDAPIVVEAQVDTQGRVYDYSILEGPKDANVQVEVQENLLSSVFRPATVFGVPVKGHVVLTYTGVSVKG
jgi:hypothetical protein